MPPNGLRATIRVLLVAAWLVASLAALGPPAAAAAPLDEPAADALADTEQATGYLQLLVNEINVRRAWAGTQPVAMAPVTANAGVAQYLADLTPRMLSSGACFHGDGNPVRPAWDYVASTGFPAWGQGEVLACPATGAYWTAARIAEGWWRSGLHHGILYDDPTVNLIACGTFGPQRSGSAYLTIACVTFHV